MDLAGRWFPVLVSCLVSLSIGVDCRGEDALAVEGEVRYEPPTQDAQVDSRFRLPSHSFSFRQRQITETDAVTMSEVTYPSPVTTEQPSNNTVHCEYFRPRSGEAMPGVVVLHILGGDFPLARLFCYSLARRNVAALFLKMPYYGPRRDPTSAQRMISKDPRQTVAGMTQAVLDIRRGTAWLASRPEIDAERLGVFGISLGGITAALAATAEPRLNNVCLVLAGGDVGQIAWESPELEEIRNYWLRRGGTRQQFLAAMESIDPVRYAANVRGRRILMLNADEDEVIPKPCTLSLWRAFGEPEIVWYDGGHYSVAWHLVDALERVPRFFCGR
jgi:dienelactone hydrolase